MPSPIKNLRPSEIGLLLRGEIEPIFAWCQTWVARRLLLHVAVIILGSGLYGAAMGWWRDPQQGIFVAVKFPLIILLVTLGNSLINGMLAPLLGLDIQFRQSFSVILMSFTITAACLGAFSPIMAFLVWNAPEMSSKASGNLGYDFILLAHVTIIGLAGVAGNTRLFQLLLRLGGSRMIALRVMLAWLSGNLFLGSQLTWILRPFIGSPTLPVEFLRRNAFQGNFYEAVFHSLRQILDQ
jgi:hypothetical protein